MRTPLFLLFFSLFYFSVHAQTVHTGYRDGRVIFKVHNTSNEFIPNYPIEIENPYFDSMVMDYGIRRIRRITEEPTSIRLCRTYILDFDSITKVDSLIERISQFSNIQYVKKAALLQLFGAPNDPNLSFQWAWLKIMADSAFKLPAGNNKEIILSVIDDAILTSHQDLSGVLFQNDAEINGLMGLDDDMNGFVDDAYGWDFADEDNDVNPLYATDVFFSHGTQVASIAGAEVNNEKGIASLNFQNRIKILPIKVADGDSAYTDESDLAIAVRYSALMGAKVVNMSLGRYDTVTAVKEAIEDYPNVIFVCAAGNSGKEEYSYPASYNLPNIISVGATNPYDEKAALSTYNDGIDIMAPGTGMIGAIATDTNSYNYSSGTSFAAPLVAGLCALVWSYDSMLNYQDVIDRVLNTADDIAGLNPQYTGKIGVGRINAFRALNPLYPDYNASFVTQNGRNHCVNSTVTFTALSYTGVTYHWDFGDGIIDSTSGHTPHHLYVSSGSHTVSLRIRDSLSKQQLAFASYNAFIITYPCNAIKSNQNNWYFGYYAGLNFAQGYPVPDTMPAYMNTFKTDGATISVSSDSGVVRYYSGYLQIGNPYENLATWYGKGHYEVTRLDHYPYAAPKQGMVNITYGDKHYAFYTTTDLYGPLFPLSYYKTSFDNFGNLTSGTESMIPITVRNSAVPFQDTLDYGEIICSQNILAIPGCDSVHWLITQGFPGNLVHTGVHSNQIIVLKVTPDSSLLDVKIHDLYSVPPPYNITNKEAYFKASPDGNFIARSNDPAYTGFQTSTDLFKFNKQSGKITFHKRLKGGASGGLSFSPSGRFLYVISGASVIQYDLWLEDPNAHYTTFGFESLNGYGSMQLGPDGKIYIALNESGNLASISFPDSLNTKEKPNNCGFNDKWPLLDPRATSKFGLPNMIDAKPFHQLEPGFQIEASGCNGMYFYPNMRNCDTTFIWKFGDGDSAIGKSPFHIYAKSGVYQVTLINGGDTVTKPVDVGVLKDIIGDTAICDSSFIYNYHTKHEGYNNYQWTITGGVMLSESSSATIQAKFNQHGTLKVVVVDRVTGCKDSSQVQIVYGSIPGNRISLDSQPCIAYLNGTTLVAGVGTTSYQWQFGKDTSSLSNLDTLEDMSYFVQTDSLFFRRVASNAQCETPSNWLKVFSKPQINVYHVIPNLICDGDTLSYIDKHQVSIQNWDMNPVWIQVYEKPLSAGFYTHLDSFLYERDTILEIPIVLGDSLYFGIETDCGFVTSRKFGVPFGEKNNIISLTDPACFPGAAYSAFGSEIDNNSPLNYEWQWSSPNSNLWQVISSSDSSIHLNSVYSYNFRNVLLRRIVSDSSCSSTSDTLNVFPQLFITSHPQDISSCSGDGNTPYTFRFEVEATPQRSYTAYLMARKFVSPFGYIYLAVDSVHHVSYLNEMDSVVYTPDATTDSFFFRMVTSCGYYDSDTAKRFPCNSTSWTVSSPDTMYTTEDSSVQMIAHLDLCSGGPVLNGAYTYWQHSANGTNWYLLNDTCGDTLRFRASSCDNGLYYRMAFHTPCQPSDLYSPVIRLYVTQTNFAKLMMRDYWDDNGTEPNYTTDWRNLYNPPSLIIRKNADGGTTPELPDWGSDTAVYVYYTIRNADNSDTSKPAKLKMYWTSGGPNGADWPIAWRDVIGNRFVNLDPGNDSAYLNTYPYGDLINEIPIDVPPIAPGDSIRTYFKWNSFPNPLRYYTKVNGSYVYDNPRIMCLLARIETCPLDSFGMSYKEISATRQNIINNRKIVGRNMTVTNLHWVYGKKDNFPLTVRRFEGDDEPIRLVLAQVGTCSFGSFGRIRVTLSDNLWDAWVAGGYTGSGYSIVSTNILEVTNISAFEIRNIDLDPGYVESMDVEYELTSNPLGSYSCQFTLAQYQGNSAPDPYGAYLMGVNFQGVPDIGIGGKVEKPEEKNATVPDSVSTFNEQQERGSNKPISTNSEFVRAGSLFAYPNPFTNEVKFFFELIGEHRVGFEVYNGFGALVGQIEPQRFSDGNHKVDFNGSHLAPGLYHCKVTIDNEIKILRLIIAR